MTTQASETILERRRRLDRERQAAAEREARERRARLRTGLAPPPTTIEEQAARFPETIWPSVPFQPEAQARFLSPFTTALRAVALPFELLGGEATRAISAAGESFGAPPIRGLPPARELAREESLSDRLRRDLEISRETRAGQIVTGVAALGVPATFPYNLAARAGTEGLGAARAALRPVAAGAGEVATGARLGLQAPARGFGVPGGAVGDVGEGIPLAARPERGRNLAVSPRAIRPGRTEAAEQAARPAPKVGEVVGPPELPPGGPPKPPPPSFRDTYRRLYRDAKPPKKEHGNWWRRQQEIWVDAQAGLRAAETRAQRPRAGKTRIPPSEPPPGAIVTREAELGPFQGNLLGPTDAMLPGAPESLTNIIIQYPGLSNAALTRFSRAIGELRRMAPLVNPELVETIVNLRHFRDILRMKGPGRVLPGGIKTEAEIDDAINGILAELGGVGSAKAEQAGRAADFIRRTYKEMLQEKVDEGVVSKAFATVLDERYPWYNRLQYIQHLDDPVIATGRAGPVGLKGNAIKALTEEGSAQQAQHPLDTLFDTMLRHERQLWSNRAARSMVRTLLDDPDSSGLIKELPIQGRGFARYVMADGKRIPIPFTDKVPNVVTFLDQGRLTAFRVPAWAKHEMDTLAAMLNRSDNLLDSFMRQLANITRAGATTYNPAFIAFNATFDAANVWATRGITPKALLGRLAAQARTLQSDPTTELFALAGGRRGRFFGLETDPTLGREVLTGRAVERLGVARGKPFGQEHRDMAGALRSIRDFIPNVGQMVEQGPRQAVFERTLDRLMPGWKTADPMLIRSSWQARQAMAEAIESTLNFHRGGEAINWINRYVPFARASVAGVAHPFRALGIGGAKIVGQEAWATRARVAGMMTLQAGLTAYNMQYEEYWDIPSRERYGKIIIMLPTEKRDPHGRKIPNYASVLPGTREWGIMLGGTTFALENAFGDDEDSFGAFAKVLGPNVIPFGGSIPLPPALEEVLGQAMNRDFYRRGPIVPADIAELPAGEQAGPFTSRVSRETFGRAGISPDRAEHFIERIFAFPGRFGLDVGDVILNVIDPKRTDPQIADLVVEYRALDTEPDRALFMRRLSPTTQERVRAALRAPESRIPALGDVKARFYAPRGGRQFQRDIEAGGERVSPEKVRLAQKRRTEIQQERVTGENALGEVFDKGEVSTDGFREGYSNLQRDVAMKIAGVNAAFKQFKERPEVAQAHATFRQTGELPDYAALGLLPKDAKEAALFQHYDAFDLAATPWGRINNDALDEIMAVYEREWTEEQRDYVRDFVQAKFHEHPTVKEYVAFRAAREEAGWYDLVAIAQAIQPTPATAGAPVEPGWAQLSPQVRKMLLAWIAERGRIGAAGKERFIRNYSAQSGSQAGIVRGWLGWFDEKAVERRGAMREANPELDAGQARFYGSVPRTIAGLAAIVDSGIDKMLRGKGEGRLAPEERDALADAGVTTIRALAAEDPVELAQRTRLDAADVRYWVNLAARAVERARRKAVPAKEAA